MRYATPGKGPFTFYVSPAVEILKTNWSQDFTLNIMDRDGGQSAPDELLTKRYFSPKKATTGGYPTVVSTEGDDNVGDIYLEWQ